MDPLGLLPFTDSQDPIFSGSLFVNSPTAGVVSHETVAHGTGAPGSPGTLGYGPGQVNPFGQSIAKTTPPPPPSGESVAPPSVVPQEPKELEIESDLLDSLIQRAKEAGDYHKWADQVSVDPMVLANSDLLCAVLASDRLYRKLVS